MSSYGVLNEEWNGNSGNIPIRHSTKRWNSNWIISPCVAFIIRSHKLLTVATVPHKLLIVTTAGTIRKFRSDEKKVSVFSVNSLKAIGVPLASIHLLTYRGPGP